MGLFSRKTKKSDRMYKSEDAQEEKDEMYGKRKDPFLVIGDAPPRPMFAGKGLEPNTLYQYSREDKSDSQGASLVHIRSPA